MFMRLLILESDKNSRWIKIVGFVFILIRFADWPYELAFLPEENALQSSQLATEGTTCWAMANGVIILNFIGDCLCNLFLSGMFVKRLYSHIRRSRKVMSHHNCIIEYIARKSLIYLALTFVVNLIMNIFKITMFLGDRSDAFTVYFAIIESTLLVEALRVDHPGIRDQNSCQQCANSNLPEISMHPRRRRWKRDSDEEANIPDIIYTNPNYPDKVDVDAIQLKPTGLSKTISLVNKNIPFYSPSASYQTSTVPHYHLKSAATVQQTSSAPPFAPPTQAAPVRPVVRSSGEIEVAPIVSLRSIGLVDQSSWDSSRDKQL
ncbi:hypothetical protein BC940DRAFT_243517 [Gongronella butleri]|nr:hypothetical protein BC940DRAFT_243517 [Gongronella butleri]